MDCQPTNLHKPNKDISKSNIQENVLSTLINNTMWKDFRITKFPITFRRYWPRQIFKFISFSLCQKFLFWHIAFRKNLFQYEYNTAFICSEELFQYLCLIVDPYYHCFMYFAVNWIQNCRIREKNSGKEWIFSEELMKFELKYLN